VSGTIQSDHAAYKRHVIVARAIVALGGSRTSEPTHPQIKLFSQIKTMRRKSQLTVGAMLLACNLITTHAAVLLGDWSPTTRQSLRNSHGEDEAVEVQTAVIEIPGYGGSATIRNVFRPTTGALWLGFDSPSYCLLETQIVAARTLGSQLLFSVSTNIAKNEEEVSRTSAEFIKSLTSIVADVTQDDLAINLSDIFGLRTIVRHSSSPAAQMIVIRGIDWVDGGIGILLTSAFEDAILLTFDPKLKPWKARFNKVEMLVVVAPMISTKASTSTDWGFPQARLVVGKAAKLAARTRVTNKPILTDCNGTEIQFLTCLCEDGRVWIGPSGTDFIYNDSHVLGFFLNHAQPKRLEVFQSSIRLPLDKNCYQAFQDWRDGAVSRISAGVYEGQRVITELDSLPCID